MKLFKKVLFLVLTVNLVFIVNFLISSTQAQFFTHDQSGGTVECWSSSDNYTFAGNITIAGENSITIDQADNTAQFMFEGDLKNTSGNETSFLLLVELPDISPDFFTSDLFLDGSRQKYLANDAGLSVIIAGNESNDEIELTNLDDNIKENNVTAALKVRKFNDYYASGEIKVRFPKSILIQSSNKGEKKQDNGKIIVNCTFKKVPVVLEK